MFRAYRLVACKLILPVVLMPLLIAGCSGLHVAKKCRMEIGRPKETSFLQVVKCCFPLTR